MLTIRLQANNCHLRTRCVGCGEIFSTDDDVVAVLQRELQLLPMEDEDRIGEVCEDCLAAGPNGILQRMRGWADQLEAAAANLRSLAAEDLGPFVTSDEYRAAATIEDAFVEWEGGAL